MIYRIAALKILLLVCSTNICFAQNSVLGANEIRAIDTLVEKLALSDKFSGAILIAKGQNIIYSKATGIANRETNSSINLDTKFNLASMNKIFTGIAIAQLAEQKKLKFSDKLIKFLPNLPQNIYGKITIHQLLTHTAGTGDVFTNPGFWYIKDTAKTISTYVDIGIDDPLWNKPGHKFEYSNYGYFLLGAVIEKLSNLSYYDYVKKNIFYVANMQNTDSYEANEANTNLAIGYSVPPQMPSQKNSPLSEKKEREPNTRLMPVKGNSAGGGYSTVKDLYLFSMALSAGKLLSQQSVTTITTGKINVPPPPMPANVQPLPQRKYGYGFGESFINNIRVIGHNGGTLGVDAHFYLYPTLGYTVVVLSNYDRAGEPILKCIQTIITQNK